MTKYITPILITLALLTTTTAASAHVPPPTTIEPNTEVPFPTYGNTTLGDCTFAAAADWTILEDHVTPAEDEVKLDFYEAGGSNEHGLYAETMFSFWAKRGIDGHHHLFEEQENVARLTVEEAVAHHGAIIAEVKLHKGEIVGPSETLEGYHMLVIDGYGLGGPSIVTWGFTTSLSWTQWAADGQRIFLPKTVTPVVRTSKHRKHHRRHSR